MKKPSARVIEHLVGLLALALALTGLLIYAIQEPQRIVAGTGSPAAARPG